MPRKNGMAGPYGKYLQTVLVMKDKEYKPTITSSNKNSYIDSKYEFDYFWWGTPAQWGYEDEWKKIRKSTYKLRVIIMLKSKEEVGGRSCPVNRCTSKGNLYLLEYMINFFYTL